MLSLAKLGRQGEIGLAKLSGINNMTFHCNIYRRTKLVHVHALAPPEKECFQYSNGDLV